MKNILVFNDISGLGNCSLGANLPVFAKLGHNAVPIVTATFSCQTGFEHFTCQKNAHLSQCVADVLSERVPSAIYVGFCVDVEILSQVETAVRAQKEAYVFVDPILGDNGKLYSIFDQNYVEKMKTVVRGAKCISPNLTEACLLSNVDYEELISHREEPTFLATCGKIFENFLNETGAENAVITGVDCKTAIGNIVLQKGEKPRFVTNDKVLVNYSGTGDLFSSALLGKLLCGSNLVTATETAANFVQKAAAQTQCKERRFGVEFCRVLNLLD